MTDQTGLIHRLTFLPFAHTHFCWFCHVMAQIMIYLNYSKTCVKWPLSKRPEIGFQDQLWLNEQGCGNTMPDLSDLVPFHSGQVENFNLLVLGQVQNLYKVNKILYFIFWLIIMSSHLALKTVWILLSWLLQKPADLDLHYLQESWYLHGFILFPKV